MNVAALIVVVYNLLFSTVQALQAADFYVANLPNLTTNANVPVMHAGLISSPDLNEDNGNLFFWHFRATKSAARDTVIWFNGGPGCSSMDGNFLEIGPFRFMENGELTGVDGSWAEHANIMFIDQPFGTGYSSPTTEAHADSLQDAGVAVVSFLTRYLEIFPELAATNVYLAGESFAGQSIPYLYDEIKKNEDLNAKLGGIKGIILGNPWIDPPHQYLSYTNFAKSRSILPKEHWEETQKYHEECMSKLSEPGMTERVQIQECERIALVIIGDSKIDEKHCMNIYDYTLTSSFPQCGMDWPAEVPLMVEYLSRLDVQQALHIPDTKNNKNHWTECNGGVRKFLKMDTSVSSLHLMPSILAEVPVLLMIGDHDFVCNMDGINEFVRNLQFNGETGFSGQEELTEYGSWQSERNLSLAHVTNGSHMLPVDHLKLSQKLFHQFANIDGDDDKDANNDGGEKTGDQTDENTGTGEPDNTSDNGKEMDKVRRRAYKQASIAALCIVIIIELVIAFIYFKGGRLLSLREMLHAVMHTNFRSTRSDDVEMDRHILTEPILEDEGEYEDEEDFEV